MTDRAKKISELSSLVSPTGDDILLIVDNPAGTPVTKSVTVSNLLGNSSANVVIYGNTTPANSAITIKKGTLIFDNDYLYVAVANNTIKRISLESF